jgi:hypothetical protein
MRSERELAWLVVDSTAERFTADDRLRVYTPLGSGDCFQAIAEVLNIVARERYPLADSLVRALTRWLDAYIGCDREPATRNVLSGISRRTESDVSRDCAGPPVPLPEPPATLRITDRYRATGGFQVGRAAGSVRCERRTERGRRPRTGASPRAHTA